MPPEVLLAWKYPRYSATTRRTCSGARCTHARWWARAGPPCSTGQPPAALPYQRHRTCRQRSPAIHTKHTHAPRQTHTHRQAGRQAHTTGRHLRVAHHAGTHISLHKARLGRAPRNGARLPCSGEARGQGQGRPGAAAEAPSLAGRSAAASVPPGEHGSVAGSTSHGISKCGTAGTLRKLVRMPWASMLAFFRITLQAG